VAFVVALDASCADGARRLFTWRLRLDEKMTPSDMQKLSQVDPIRVVVHGRLFHRSSSHDSRIVVITE
jgi:hypothetical protein